MLAVESDFFACGKVSSRKFNTKHANAMEWNDSSRCSVILLRFCAVILINLIKLIDFCIAWKTKHYLSRDRKHEIRWVNKRFGFFWIMSYKYLLDTRYLQKQNIDHRLSLLAECLWIRAYQQSNRSLIQSSSIFPNISYPNNSINIIIRFTASTQNLPHINKKFAYVQVIIAA